MADYQAKVTLAGQAKIAAALANAGIIDISAVAAGDGNGAPVVAVVTMAGLVHEVWRGAPTGVSRDPVYPTQVLVTFTIPASAAPFIAREIGLFTGDGQLFCIASIPATPIVTPTDGATNSMDITVPIVVDTAANVTITINPATLIPLAQLLRAPFIGIDSFSNAPPANPAVGALVVVGAAPTGAFANRAHQFAQWTGTLWLFAPAPIMTIVGNAADARYYQRTLTGWREWRATEFPTGGSLTLWVRPDGNDANDGSANDAAHAFLTVQAAITYANAKYSLSGAALTIRLGVAGTYPSSINLNNLAGSITIEGSAAAPASYVLSDVYVAGSRLTLRGVKLSVAAGNYLLTSANASSVICDTCHFAGGAATNLIATLSAGTVTLINTNTVASGGAICLYANGGAIVTAGSTLVILGAPAFAYAFANAVHSGSTIIAQGTTITGSATGPRYKAEILGEIYTNGGGVNFFPGNVAGTASLGGQFN